MTIVFTCHKLCILTYLLEKQNIADVYILISVFKIAGSVDVVNILISVFKIAGSIDVANILISVFKIAGSIDVANILISVFKIAGSIDVARMKVRNYFHELRETLNRQEIVALTTVDTHIREKLCMLQQQQEDMTMLLSQISAVCHQCETTLQSVSIVKFHL